MTGDIIFAAAHTGFCPAHLALYIALSALMSKVSTFRRTSRPTGLSRAYHRSSFLRTTPMSEDLKDPRLNALHDCAAAVVFACVRRLPPDEQRAFYADLQTMRLAHAASGNTTADKLLGDLCQACVMAAPGAFRN